MSTWAEDLPAAPAEPIAPELLCTRAAAVRSQLLDLAAQCDAARLLKASVHLRVGAETLADMISEVSWYASGKQGMWPGRG